MSENLLEQALQYYADGNYQLSFELYKTLADSGDAEAQCEMGFFYYSGDVNIGIAKNEEIAIQYFEKAAEQNHSKAEFQLGYIERHRNNGEKAIYWYNRCIEHGGDTKKIALNNIGVLYLSGEAGIEQNVQLALEYYDKAAREGYATAAENAGRVYLNGKYVPQNKEIARHYFKAAAILGSESAQAVLDFEFDDDDEPTEMTTPSEPQKTSSAVPTEENGRGNAFFGVLSGLGGAAVALMVMVIIANDLFFVFGIAISVSAVLAIIIGAINGIKGRNDRAFLVSAVCVVIACLIMLPFANDGLGDYNGGGLTQQEKDNLEFYYELEDRWENYRNEYNN